MANVAAEDAAPAAAPESFKVNGLKKEVERQVAPQGP